MGWCVGSQVPVQWKVVLITLRQSTGGRAGLEWDSSGWHPGSWKCFWRDLGAPEAGVAIRKVTGSSVDRSELPSAEITWTGTDEKAPTEAL